VQAAPVFLDREATIAKACGLTAEVAAAGARLVVFPEAFVPANPVWVWHIPAGETQALRQLYAVLVDPMSFS
jgi:predicted amidohydrolase